MIMKAAIATIDRSSVKVTVDSGTDRIDPMHGQSMSRPRRKADRTPNVPKANTAMVIHWVTAGAKPDKYANQAKFDKRIDQRIVGNAACQQVIHLKPAAKALEIKNLQQGKDAQEHAP